MRFVMSFLSVLVATAAAIAQNAPATQSSPSDALQTLLQVTQKYADATSLHLEATQETTDLWRLEAVFGELWPDCYTEDDLWKLESSAGVCAEAPSRGGRLRSRLEDNSLALP